MDWIPRAAPVPHIEQAAYCGGKEETSREGGRGGRKAQRGDSNIRQPEVFSCSHFKDKKGKVQR